MRLLIQEAGQPPREFEAVVGLTIGRGSTNQCALADDAASSSHARIVSVGGRLAIEDVGSSNGTWIEGGPKLARGVPQPLAPKLKLLIGRTSIEVLGPAGAPADELSADQTIAPEAQRAGGARGRPAAPDATLAPRKDDQVTLPGGAMKRPIDSGPMTVPPKKARQVAPKQEPSSAGPTAGTPQKAPTPEKKQAPPKAPLPPKRGAEPPPDPEPTPSVREAPGQALSPTPPSNPPSIALTIGGTLRAGGGDLDEVAIQVRLSALKPRLVFVSHKVGQMKGIRHPKTEIGRREGKSVTLGLEDEGVSSIHAQITFDGHAFYVEDLGSSNGTWVGETRLAARSGRVQVRCDQLIRVGTVDVLFLHDSVAGEGQGTQELYAGALANLQRAPAIAPAKLREAAQQLKSGNHPGEHLIVGNAIGVAQWCEAVEEARLRRKLNKTGRGRPKAVFWLLAIVLIAVAAFVAMKLLR